MATTTTKKDVDGNEYVDLFIPRGYANEDPNEIISDPKGKLYLLPKGKTSRVPLCIKEEWERSQRAKEKLYATSDALLERTKAPIGEY